MEAAQDEYTLATVVLAVVPIVLAVVSLTWGVSLYLLTGSRVRVRLWDARIGPNDAYRIPHDGDDGWSVPPGYHPGMAVTAQNVGRLPVSIIQATVSLKPSGIVCPPFDPHPSEGVRLEAGAEKTWYFTLDDARAMVTAARQGPQQAEVRLDLGNGKRKAARKRPTLTPLEN